jgi:Mg-chelatase subunit ChlD
MNNKITEIVFIVDASGSMCGLRGDTVGGINSMLLEQKKTQNGDTVYVSMVSFNVASKVLYDREKLEKTPLLNEKDYATYGGTALLDAVGDAIKHIANVHKYAREEDRPQKTLFVIVTDGYENSSHRFSYEQVKSLIESKQEKGWEFVFLGANLDSCETAASIGICSERAMDWKADSDGEAKMFRAASYCMHSVRSRAEVNLREFEKTDGEFDEVCGGIKPTSSCKDKK